MPRKTKHQMCDKCLEEAIVCTRLSYYEVLGTRARAGSPHKQVTGTLPPTEGWCLKCFLEFAKKRKISRAEIQKLRQRLTLPPPTKQEKGSSPKTAAKRVGR
jgi:hypothetical protein